MDIEVMPLSAALGQLDLVDEAQAEIRTMLRINPGFSYKYVDRVLPTNEKNIREVILDGPELLWLGPLWKTAITFASAVAGLILIAAAIEAHDKFCATTWARLSLGAAGALLLAPFFTTLALGAALAALTIGMNRTSGDRGEKAADG